VSLQIKALEEDLGVQLFDRAGAHITLTEAGQILLGYSQQLSALVARTEHDIAALSVEHAGSLALGLPRPSRSMCCPAYWPSFSAKILELISP